MISTGCLENHTVIQVIRDALTEIRKSNKRPDTKFVFTYKNTKCYTF